MHYTVHFTVQYSTVRYNTPRELVYCTTSKRDRIHIYFTTVGVWISRTNASGVIQLPVAVTKRPRKLRMEASKFINIFGLTIHCQALLLIGNILVCTRTVHLFKFQKKSYRYLGCARTQTYETCTVLYICMICTPYKLLTSSVQYDYCTHCTVQYKNPKWQKYKCTVLLTKNY